MTRADPPANGLLCAYAAEGRRAGHQGGWSSSSSPSCCSISSLLGFILKLLPVQEQAKSAAAKVQDKANEAAQTAKEGGSSLIDKVSALLSSG